MLGPAGQIPVASTGALLVRGSALNVATLIAGVAVSFFLMPFLIHALGDRWYGLWALVGSITSYYTLLDLGLTSAVTRFLTQAIARKDKTNANAVLVTGLVIFGGIGVIALLVSSAVALGAGWFLDDPAEIALFRSVVLILGADVALAFPFAVFNGLLVARYRFDIVSGVQLIALSMRALLIVYFVSRGYSILALAVITFAVDLPSRLALAAAAWRLFPSLKLSRAHFRSEQARELFGYGKYTFVAASADRLRFSRRHRDRGLVSGRRIGHTLCHCGTHHSACHGPDDSGFRRARTRVHAGRCAGRPCTDAPYAFAGDPGEYPGVGYAGRRHLHPWRALDRALDR
jgi:O-antigen/teichoic acid export membrane protein